MEKIIILDTNFLVANTGKINEIIPKLEKNNYHVYVPKMVQEEYINIQLRKIKELYKKIENIKSSNDFLNLKYENEEKVLKWNENGYNKSFKEYFGDNVIGYKKANILENVLARNRYKEPPFYDEPNSSDKGFKDTIIWLSIKEFINKYENKETFFYYITSDNGFVKYKNSLEKEIKDKYFEIVDIKDENKLYSKFNIEILENKKEIEENVFDSLIDGVNLDEAREKINNLMWDFNNYVDVDYYGNENIGNRYEIKKPISYNETEILLNHIQRVLKDNFFRKTINPESIFPSECQVYSKGCEISLDTLKDIDRLYHQIFKTEYKNAFIQFVMQKINKNKIEEVAFINAEDDELPF